MPSPFLGMNPYLEQERAWNDFHESFMPAARDAITAQVRPHFIAKIADSRQHARQLFQRQVLARPARD